MIRAYKANRQRLGFQAVQIQPTKSVQFENQRRKWILIKRQCQIQLQFTNFLLKLMNFDLFLTIFAEKVV